MNAALPHREERRIQMGTGIAKFPQQRTLEGFDFAAQPSSQTATAADVPGWNSFQVIEVLLALEEHFSIAMEMWDLDTVHTVGNLTQRILDRVQFRTHQVS